MARLARSSTTISPVAGSGQATRASPASSASTAADDYARAPRRRRGSARRGVSHSSSTRLVAERGDAAADGDVHGLASLVARCAACREERSWRPVPQVTCRSSSVPSAAASRSSGGGRGRRGCAWRGRRLRRAAGTWRRDPAGSQQLRRHGQIGQVCRWSPGRRSIAATIAGVAQQRGCQPARSPSPTRRRMQETQADEPALRGPGLGRRVPAAARREGWGRPASSRTRSTPPPSSSRPWPRCPATGSCRSTRRRRRCSTAPTATPTHQYAARWRPDMTSAFTGAAPHAVWCWAPGTHPASAQLDRGPPGAGADLRAAARRSSPSIAGRVNAAGAGPHPRRSAGRWPPGW